MEGISDKTPHLTGISIFQNKNKPPPLWNCQKHFVHLPAPLEKFILKRNCENVLNIRPLSLKNMTIDQS